MGGFVITTNQSHKDWADKNFSILGSKKDIKIDNIFFAYYSNQETKPLKIVNDKCYILDGHLFNGDIDFVIAKYYENSDKFTEELDGRFNFIVYDMKTKVLDFYNDPFGCVPIWRKSSTFYSFSPKVKDGYTRVEYNDYNSHCRYNFNNEKYEVVKDLHKWNLDQYKNNLDDVNKAFEESVLKCIEGFDNITLLLSAGWDSIAIAICLAENKKKFNAVHVNFDYGFENKDIVNEVIDYCGEYINYFELGFNLEQKWRDRFRKLYPTESSQNRSRLLITILDYIKENIADKLVLYGNHVCPLFDERECKVFVDKDRTGVKQISWPENLEDMWDNIYWCSLLPWTRYIDGAKLDIVKYRDYNCFNTIDLIGAQPYADKNLIQEWINTTQEVKAKEFRSFYKEYFRKRNITFPIRMSSSGGLGRQMSAYSNFVI